MRYAKGIDTDLQILTLLAIEKEFPQYEMPKRLGITYRTVLRHLQQLEKNEMIRLCRTEPSKKQGKERKIYTLTKIGLLSILEYKTPYEEIDTIAKNYTNIFPLVFGKWDFFKKKGLRDLIIQRLQSAVFAFVIQDRKEWYRMIAGVPEETVKIIAKKKGKEMAEKYVETNKQIMGDLTNSVLGFNLYLHPKYRSLKERVKDEKRIFRLLAQDPDIREYLSKQIRHFEEIRRSMYENVVYWQKWFENLD